MKNKGSVRESFIEHFSEEAAQLLEAAAETHNNHIHSDKGSDPFKWVVAIVLSSECTSKYQKHHGLEEFNDKKFKQWVKDHGELSTHDGDVDYLTLFLGGYDEYVKEKK